MIRDNDLMRLSEQDVIDWFEARSDTFPGLADELKSLWPQETAGHEETISLETVLVLARTSKLIDNDGFIYGANATIAELLFNDRNATGGAYNAKIQQIKQEIERIFTTTTDQNITTAAEAA